MWVPVAHALRSGGDAALIRETKWKSSNDALPEPPPPPLPPLGVPIRPTPHDHDSTSISPLCAASVDSPKMPSILRNHRSLTWTSVLLDGDLTQAESSQFRASAVRSGRHTRSMTLDLDAAVIEARRRFVDRRPVGREWAERAEVVMPGGNT